MYNVSTPLDLMIKATRCQALPYSLLELQAGWAFTRSPSSSYGATESSRASAGERPDSRSYLERSVLRRRVGFSQSTCIWIDLRALNSPGGQSPNGLTDGSTFWSTMQATGFLALSRIKATLKSKG